MLIIYVHEILIELWFAKDESSIQLILSEAYCNLVSTVKMKVVLYCSKSGSILTSCDHVLLYSLGKVVGLTCLLC